MDLGPKNIGYLLEPENSIDYVLGFDWNSMVCFLLVEVKSRKIDYFLETNHSTTEWGW